MMSSEDVPGFLYHFDTLEDPRIDRKKLYPLTELLFVVICANLCGAQSWRDLKTVIMLESRVSSGGHTAIEQRYFISSLAANAKQIAQTIRSHWAVENSLHWVLDVTLREDDSRVRKDHAPENMVMVRHIILNRLQNTKKKFKDMSIRRLQKKAGWGDSTLDMILMATF
ncbi:ISAs1 family transposase [Legionella moravica]|uniref:ISAs1 family transposase n=1 Tax=Legionella moravica TaxID=39962 RepID=UPI0009DBDEF4|nr:ISAs1 family transposase [Legionella moravica]